MYNSQKETLEQSQEAEYLSQIESLVEQVIGLLNKVQSLENLNNKLSQSLNPEE